MADKKYNGWTNYETWLVKAHIDNDEGTQRYWLDVARDCWRRSEPEPHFTRKENAAFALRDRLKEEHDTAAGDLLDAGRSFSGNPATGVFRDLLRAAISEVNFQEIASHLIDDVSEGDDE